MKPESGHWYTVSGEPAHFVDNKSRGGQRPTTLSDAKKLGLLPSVTGITKLLNKPALIDWMVRQAVHAVVTAPDIGGEALDAKIVRVLETERQQDEEARAARDRGTEVHAALEACFCTLMSGEPVVVSDKTIWPAWEEIVKVKGLSPIAVEKVLIGDGYAGKTDLIAHNESFAYIVDFKTTKKLPQRGSWTEHKLQTAAYAEAWFPESGYLTGKIRTANLYINPDKGEFAWHEQDDWFKTYHEGFAPLVKHWQWANEYTPPKPKVAAATEWDDDNYDVIP